MGGATGVVVGLAAVISVGLSTPAIASADTNCASSYEFSVPGTFIGPHVENTEVFREGDHEVAVIHAGQDFWPFGNNTFDESTNQAEGDLKSRVRWLEQNCPDSDVTVYGHSAGSHVAGNVNEELQAEGYTGKSKWILLSDSRGKYGIETKLSGLYPGASMGGPRGPMLPNTSEVCNEHTDVICDARNASDFFGLVQGIAGYFMGWHGRYNGYEQENLGPGYHAVPQPTPIPFLPASSPLPIPDLPQIGLPEWTPGPLPDLNPLIGAVNPGAYVPTKLEQFLPVELNNVLPKEVREFVPPALPVLPPLPRLF